MPAQGVLVIECESISIDKASLKDAVQALLMATWDLEGPQLPKIVHATIDGKPATFLIASLKVDGTFCKVTHALLYRMDPVTGGFDHLVTDMNGQTASSLVRTQFKAGTSPDPELQRELNDMLWLHEM